MTMAFGITYMREITNMNTYAVTDSSGKFLFDLDEDTFVRLTDRDIVLDGTWDKHRAEFGDEQFAHSDYVLRGV